jgi:hypothetical protein
MPRKHPHAFFQREEGLALLLDEHLAQQVAEQADVSPQTLVTPLDPLPDSTFDAASVAASGRHRCIRAEQPLVLQLIP